VLGRICILVDASPARYWVVKSSVQNTMSDFRSTSIETLKRKNRNPTQQTYTSVDVHAVVRFLYYLNFVA